MSSVLGVLGLQVCASVLSLFLNRFKSRCPSRFQFISRQKSVTLDKGTRCGLGCNLMIVITRHLRGHGFNPWQPTSSIHALHVEKTKENGLHISNFFANRL